MGWFFGRDGGALDPLLPDPVWLRPAPFCLCALAATVALVTLDLPHRTLCAAYAALLLGLLGNRARYFYGRGWLMLLLDLCVVSALRLLWSLWEDDRSPAAAEGQLALTLASFGPVAGTIFPLQLPLTVHHPDAFMSWFLHVSQGLVCASKGWGFAAAPGRSVGSLVGLGLRVAYGPWLLAYAAVLFSQPQLPAVVARQETFFDMIVLPESTAEKRLAWKRTEAFYTHTVVALLIHVLLSLIGFLTASMAVLSRAAFFAKVFILLAGSVESGVRFYRSCPTRTPPPGLGYGLARMLAAAAVVAFAYLLDTRVVGAFAGST